MDSRNMGRNGLIENGTDFRSGSVHATYPRITMPEAYLGGIGAYDIRLGTHSSPNFTCKSPTYTLCSLPTLHRGIFNFSLRRMRPLRTPRFFRHDTHQLWEALILEAQDRHHRWLLCGGCSIAHGRCLRIS
jgi:hypothetical protein